MQLLHIDSAITGNQSVSRQLTAQIVEAWKASHPNTQVSYLDLVTNAPAHFTMDAMAPRTGQTDGKGWRFAFSGSSASVVAISKARLTVSCPFTSLKS